MKIHIPTLADFALHSTLADPQPAPAPIGTLLRNAMDRVGQQLRGTDPEAARTDWLASASDPVDLERRADAWDRAQAASRMLPLGL